MRVKTEIEELIPEVEGERRRQRIGWAWCIAAVVCASLMYFGGVVMNRVDWTRMLIVKEEIAGQEEKVGKQEEGTAEQGGKNDQQSEGNQGLENDQRSEAGESNAKQPVQEEQKQPTKVEQPETPTGAVGAQGKKVIALTFDDGPSPVTTPRLLDILKGREAKATFFVLGTMAQKSPDILWREAAEGHEVASHTPYHHQLTKLSYAQVQAEAAEMERIFMEILGTRPPFTRPPYGSQNATVGQALGQPMVLWSIDPRDWADRNANTVCTRVVNAARDGAIILVHDIHATTVDAVPCIVDSLRAQGYEFLTVSELAASRGVKMVNGVAYYNF